MIILINAGKAFDTIQHSFIVKSLKKLVIGELYLSIIKAVYDKPIANSILNLENLKTFPLKSGTR
jgi:hypothetical protein